MSVKDWTRALRAVQKAERGRKRRPPRGRLQCRKCSSYRVTVTDKQQRLRRWERRLDATSRRDAVGVNCRNCGHEWWSIHPEAITLGKQADARRAQRA